MKRLIFSLLGAVAMLALSPVQASAQEVATGEGTLASLNDSGASSMASVSLDGTQLTVELTGSGFSESLPHAQHFHFMVGMNSTCPDESADTSGDGLVSTVEGHPAYGDVQLSLTTEGDTTAASVLAVDRFPAAGDDGALTYERTFEISAEAAEAMRGQTVAIVQHGVDVNDNGEYDFDAGASELDSALPLEATLPATCGTLTLVAGDVATPSPTPTPTPTPGNVSPKQVEQTPKGGVATGGGGTADSDSGLSTLSLAMLLVGLTVMGAGVTAIWRRSTVEA